MKPKSMRPELIVGIFAAVAMLAIIYMSRQVGDAPFVKGRGVTYIAYFNAVSGLIPKSPVEIAGITVGYVDSIGLDKAQAKLVVKVDRQIALFEDATISVRSRGILGDKFVAIQPGTLGRRQLKDGDIIVGVADGGEFGNLMETMNQAATNLRDLTKTVNTMVQEQHDRGTINRIFTNLDEMTGNLNNFIAGNTASMEAIVENMEDVSVALKSLLNNRVNDKLTQSAERLEATMSSLNRIVERVERGEGTVGKLLTDDTTVNRLNGALEGVEKFTSGIGKIQTEVSYRGEFLSQTEDFQNTIALTIRPRPDKYFRFGIVAAAQGDTSIINTQVASPPGNVISTTQTVQTDNRVLFSVEMAKRFYDATFRFGIIRNHGGMALDYSLWDDMLTISLEAFDFSRFNDRFHFRNYATLNLWQHLMLTAGIDDLLSETDDINPFIGAGISFRDDDIRTLFGSLTFSRF